MSGARKAAIRQRLWGKQGDDKADASGVSENLRRMDSALSEVPPMRLVQWDNQSYTADGLPFASKSTPIGGIVIFVSKVDGSWQSVTAVPELKPISGTQYVAKINGLTTGQRYATIRMMVFG